MVPTGESRSFQWAPGWVSQCLKVASGRPRGLWPRGELCGGAQSWCQQPVCLGRVWGEGCHFQEPLPGEFCSFCIGPKGVSTGTSCLPQLLCEGSLCFPAGRSAGSGVSSGPECGRRFHPQADQLGLAASWGTGRGRPRPELREGTATRTGAGERNPGGVSGLRGRSRVPSRKGSGGAGREVGGDLVVTIS